MRELIKVVAVGLLALTASACGEDGETVEFLLGFEPPAPGPGQIQFVSPITRDIPPGVEIIYCSYLDDSTAETLDITKTFGFQSRDGAHHMALYSAAGVGPAGTAECNDSDMLAARFIGAGGPDVLESDIPEGIVVRVEAGRQLMIQHHWVNTSDQPVDGQSAINVSIQEPSDDVVVAGLLAMGDTQFSVPANELGTAHTECVIPRDIQAFSIAGHAHEWATRVTMSHTPAGGSATQIYDSGAWQEEFVFHPPKLRYSKAEPFNFSAGDTLSIDCSFSNTTDEALSFPHEMCFAVVDYFPAGAKLECTNGTWSE